MKLRTTAIAFFVSTLAAAASAQTVPTEFPEGAKALAPEALKAMVSGKTFNAKLADGTPWRLQYTASGYIYVNAGSFSGSGKWHVEGTNLCNVSTQIPTACNEMQAKDGVLYMKRSTGEIVKLVEKT
jgi:hypothetical protein